MKVKKGSIGEAFLEAIPYLWDSRFICKPQKTPFICVALYYAYMDDRISSEQFKTAKHLIQDRLTYKNGVQASTVTGWLQSKGYLKMGNLNKTDWKNVQEYRHRWMMAMAEEFANVMPEEVL